VAPEGGTAPEDVTITIPTDSDGNALVPGVLSFGDLTADQVVTAGPSVVHSYTVAGTYNATYTLTGQSGPVWTSPDIVIT